MTNKVLKLALVLTLIMSCQIEEDGAPSPTDGFIKYLGNFETYNPNDLEFINGDEANGVIIVGSLQSTMTSDAFVMTSTSDGIFLSLDTINIQISATIDEEPVALDGQDIAYQVESFEDGFATVITSSVNDNANEIFDVEFASIYYSNATTGITNTINLFSNADTATALLSGLNVTGNDIIKINNDPGCDNCFLFGGSIEVDRGGGVTDLDFLVRKYEFDPADGSAVELFEFTSGIQGAGQDERLARVFEKDNGNLVVIGSSFRASDEGENAGNNGENIRFIELTAGGDQIDGTTYGFDDGVDDNVFFNDRVSDAIQTPTGFAITGTSTTSDENEYAFFLNLNSSGRLKFATQEEAGDTLTSFVSSSLETRGIGIVPTIDNRYIVLGEYLNYQDGNGNRAGEGFFMKVNPSGVPIHEANYGSSSGNDRAVDGLLLEDGKILVLADIDFGGGIELVSLIKTNDNGEIQN